MMLETNAHLAEFVLVITDAVCYFSGECKNYDRRITKKMLENSLLRTLLSNIHSWQGLSISGFHL